MPFFSLTLLALAVALQVTGVISSVDPYVVQGNYSEGAGLLRGSRIISNGSDVEIPIDPEEDRKITLTRRSFREEAIPRGKLAHHLLTIATNFWEDDLNHPYFDNREVRDSCFKDIITVLFPHPYTLRMTPENLAWGFGQIAQDVITDRDWKALSYKWSYIRAFVGITETYIDEESSHKQPTGNKAEMTMVKICTDSNAPQIRTSFTGTVVPAKEFLLLVRKTLIGIWSLDAHQPIQTTYPVPGTMSLSIPLPDGSHSLKLEIALINLRYGARAVKWNQITLRILLMLQLPAHLERWESLTSNFGIGNTRIATLTISQVLRSQDSQMGKRDEGDLKFVASENGGPAEVS